MSSNYTNQREYSLEKGTLRVYPRPFDDTFFSNRYPTVEWFETSNRADDNCYAVFFNVKRKPSELNTPITVAKDGFPSGESD